MKFLDIKKINSKILKSLEEIGFSEMSLIQEKSIPSAIEGFDIIGQAQTGTGKTAAFGIPIMNMLDNQSNDIEHLIIAPTRELATQIYNQFLLIGKYLSPRLALILGGVSYEKQVKQLSNKPNVIIGTPGRICDYLNNKRIKLTKIKTFTLDEADELLNMGFKDEIDTIISFLPKKRQNFFFTATFNEKTKNLANKIVNEKVKNINISQGLATANTIKQEYIIVKEKHKFSTLIKLIEYYNPTSIIIFGRTKKRVDQLNEALNKIGFNSIAIQGNMTQKERDKVIYDFKNKQKNILVATDVVARGIDISHVEWIINFDLPQEIEYYTHRIGRVGRNGKEGYSISFVKNDEIEHIKEIAIQTNSRITKLNLPSDNEIYKNWRIGVNKKLKNIINETKKENDIPNYLEMELSKSFTNEELSILLAHYLLKEKNKHKEINISPEPSVVLKGRAKIRTIKNRINRFNKKSGTKYEKIRK